MNTSSQEPTNAIDVSSNNDWQNVTIQLIDDYAAFTELHSEWNKLAVIQSKHSIFYRHEWFDAAWQWRKFDSQLHILCIYDNGNLIGIFPGCIKSDRRSGASIRVLGFLDVPDTQFCNIIAGENYLEICTSALGGWLRENSTTWDILELNNLETSSNTLCRLSNALDQQHLSWRTIEAGRNLSIDISGKWLDYYKGRSRRLKKGNNLVANRLKRAGDIDITWLHSPNEDLEIVPTIINISSRSWKVKTGKTFDNKGPGDFIRKLSEHASNNDWFSVWTLTLDGKTIATEYQLSATGNIYALRADFDDDYSELSPGTFLNWRLLENLFDQDLCRYYMGPGENAYKHRWTDQGDPQVSFIAYGPSFKGKALAFLEQSIRPSLKRLHQFFLAMKRKKDN